MRIIRFFTNLILAISLVVGGFPVVALAQIGTIGTSGVTMSLDPSSKEVALGSSFELGVKINNLNGVATAGADAILLYDSNKLEYVSDSRRAGSLFGSTSWVVDAGSTAGRLSLGGGVQPGSTTTVTTSGIWAYATFKVKTGATLGATAINFEFDSNNPGKTTDTNVPKPGESSTDLLTGVSSGSYTIIQSAPSQPVLTSVVVTPSLVTLGPGLGQQFSATAYDQDGQIIPVVTFSWSVAPTGFGTISQTGLYTSPSSLTAQTSAIVTATATRNGVTKTGQATISLVPGAITPPVQPPITPSPPVTPPPLTGIPILFYPLLIPLNAALAYLARRRIKF